MSSSSRTTRQRRGAPPWVLKALARVGLLRPLWLARRRLVVARFPAEEPGSADGLPVPPPELRVATCHSPDRDDFLRGGEVTAAAIRALASEHGREIESMDAILEFGCGCGRVTRHWADLDGPRIHGCDIDDRLTSWCRDNLPFLNCRTNSLEPPLPYADDEFDLIYSISVFTHLSLELEHAWMAELARILKPGGLLVFTMHGTHHADAFLPAADLAKFKRGEPVIHFGELSGDRCGSFVPRSYVESELLARFNALAFSPTEQNSWVGQDLYVARLDS